MSKQIRQEVVFQAKPQQVYQALLEARQHTPAEGEAAMVTSQQAGGEFSHGMVSGRHVELVPGERIVQAWRVGAWPPGLYSMVRFDLKDEGGTTRLSLEHSAFPEAMIEHLEKGWQMKYWEPLKKYLS